MNIVMDKTVRPYLQDADIMNQIQYAVNQMMVEKENEKERTTTQAIHTMVGTFYIYEYDSTIYVMKES